MAHKKEQKFKPHHFYMIVGPILIIYLGIRIATAIVECTADNIFEQIGFVSSEILENPWHFAFGPAMWGIALATIGIALVVLAMGISQTYFAQWKWDAYYEEKRKQGLIKPKGIDVIDDKFSVKSLDEMIGLGAVKDEINDIISYYALQKQRKKKGLPATDLNINMVFYGNPGTGKTVVARYIAKELKKHKVVSKGQFVEVDRSIMVASGPGQTAPLVHEIVEMAIGGVLFIDEAYTLTQDRDQFGMEAVNTLLKLMEDYKEDIIVIIAGYNDLMDDFIKSNPGLESRFTKHIHFPNYNAEELCQIFDMTCKKRQYACTDLAKSKAKELFARALHAREPDFANGRFVRNVFEAAIAKQAGRISKLTVISKAEMQVITDEDIDFGKYSQDSAAAVANIEGLIGMKAIKDQVDSILDFMITQIKREKAGLEKSSVSGHMVFTGNPGTGKTTVARYMAGVLKNAGVLSRGNLVEVDRADLIGEYSGQTAPKTQEIVKKALGGVLFIDEAYSLTMQGDSYGQEAVATLLKMMEDNREDLIVIVAGYTDLMKNFIDSNPGLQSRFNTYLEFPDYDVNELVEIFYFFCAKEKYNLLDECEPKVRAYFENLVANKEANFANARNARNLYEKTLLKQASRMAKLDDATAEDLMKISADDIAC